MAKTKRHEILRTAWHLFEAQGYHATGINQIITESGVPKGSFYHYFPDGKEGLAIEAIEHIGELMRQRIREGCTEPNDPSAAIGGLFRNIACKLEESGFQHGGPLTIVTLETATTNERLNHACQRAYNNALEELFYFLRSASYSEADARELSTLIFAGLEGGILLARTLHSTEPMEQIARQMEHALRIRQEETSEATR